MAVPSSGELKLWDNIWNQEIGGTQGNNSLHSASVYAEFTSPDAMSDFYGWSDIEIPSVTTTDITATCYARVCACGTITSTGNSTSLTRGFYIGTSANPYASNTKYTVSGTQSTTGLFKYDLTGRTQNTRYYAWAWAANEAGETVGGRDCVITPFPPFTPANGTLRTGYAATSTGWQVNYPAQAQHGYINPYSGAFASQFNISTPQYGIDYCAAIYCTASTNAQNRKRAFLQAAPAECGCRWDATVFSCQTYPYCMYNMLVCAGDNGFDTSGRFIVPHYAAPGTDANADQRFCYCCSSDIRLKTNINYL